MMMSKTKHTQTVIVPRLSAVHAQYLQQMLRIPNKSIISNTLNLRQDSPSLLQSLYLQNS